MNESFKDMALAGWGRYKPVPCHVFRPERRDTLLSLLNGAAPGPVLARGLGRSYGDAAVNRDGSVVDMTRLNRMRSFDPETGELECESGVSLSEIISTFLPRGWFPGVVPGTRFVTVGGAIAHDVHGKNHHRDGSFGNFVESIDLWTPALGVVTCSPAENSDIFWATVGGAGLTGVILSARLRLRRVESAYVRADYQRCANIDAALDAFDATDEDYTYSVAWVDCLATADSLGRSVLMRGNPAAPGELPRGPANKPLRTPRRFNATVPFDFPGFVLNPLSIRAFNETFYALNRPSTGKWVDYDKYFFPLDRILHWNRMYGRRGFVQYQATFPPEGRAGLRVMLEKCSVARRASFLAVLKKFGDSGRGMLSHPMRGYTLTLDIADSSGLASFLGELDRILLDHGGRLYLAKDAAAPAEVIAAMYPRLEEFRSVLRRVDPEGRLGSDLARRTGIGLPARETHDA